MLRKEFVVQVVACVFLGRYACAIVPPDYDDATVRAKGSVSSGGVGSCCDQIAETCRDGVAQADCAGVGEVWNGNRPCCEVECRSLFGPEFDAQDVALLSRVTMSEFQSFVAAGEPHLGNENWGYTSPRGRNYSIMGFTTGTGIVEITDPMNPTIIAYIGGEGIDSVWRDMATYREYLYIVTDGGGVGLQIVDLSDIDSGIVTHVATTDLGVGFIDAHNVAVNEDSGFLYLMIPNINSGRGLAMFSLANPASPQFAGFWTDTAANVTCHDAQIVSYTSGVSAGREIAFCLAGDDGLKIADLTDKSNPFTVSTMIYPALTFAHQGWLSEDGRYLFFGDELDELSNKVAQTTTYIVDVQDLANPTLVTTFLHGGCWIDHNMMVRGDRLYQAQYSAGLRVLDVSDPLSPIEVGFFDTRPEDNLQGFPGAWGVYSQYKSRVITISDRQRALFVLLDQPSRPVARITSDVGTVDFLVPVTFTGGSALPIPEASAITNWEWDLDYDGVTFDIDATGQQVQRSFLFSGIHRVALRVTDVEGDQDLATHEILVEGSVPTVSQWGLVTMALSLLCAGTILLRRFRTVAEALAR